MQRIKRGNMTVFSFSFSTFFFIFVCQIIATIAKIQSEISLQDSSIDHNESSSLPKENTTIIEEVELHAPRAFADGVCGLNYFCQNGGKCTEDSKKCDCKPGTSGDFCQNVDECKDSLKCGDGSNVQCIYDEEKEKAVCHCKYQYYGFDEEKLRCKECDCGPYGNCSFVKGKKTCDCKKGYALNRYDFDMYDERGICKECKCGEHSDGCEWSRSSKKCHCHKGYDQDYDQCSKCDCGVNGKCHFHNYHKVCDCDSGFADYDGTCKECVCGVHSTCHFRNWRPICECQSGYSDKGGTCAECNCGSKGKCHFDGWTKICDCDERFSDNGGICEECDCGPYGNCTFKNGNKTCSCQEGYGLDDKHFNPGICEKCNCYKGQDPINCIFLSGIRHCLCPSGYEQIWDNCEDIDECKDQNACPKYSVCENIPGSYKCRCKPGFTQNVFLEVKDHGCIDINECLEDDATCPFTDTTECVNTIGSYDCVCKFGYVSQFGKSSIEYEGCMEDQTSWKIGYALLIVLFGFISLGLLVSIRKQYRVNRT